MINRLQLFEIDHSLYGASSKARSDINYIVEKNGYKTILLKTKINSKNILVKFLEKLIYVLNLLVKCYLLNKGSLLFLQIPFLNLSNLSHFIILLACKIKKIKIICIIHDINEIRKKRLSSSGFYHLLDESSVVISHNAAMKQYLAQKSIDARKIINLEIFDYILNKNEKIIKYEKKIVIAGNLSPQKSGYIDLLKRLQGYHIDLYGPGYMSEKECKNISYKGCVGSNELPLILNSGFGLVWDGNSIDTCKGLYGNYLRYNNPHKLSLYLAAGLPVIIWSQAAEADFVTKNKVGITVDSLYDLEDIFRNLSEEQYKNMTAHVKTVQKKLVHGYYIYSALKKAEKLIL